MNKKGIFFSLLIVISLVLSACGFTGSDEETSDSDNKDKGTEKKDQDTLNLYFDNDIPDLNPLKSTDEISFSVLGNVMEGLYRLDKDDKPVPAMAKDVKKSDDGLTYTFTLRDGIKWSNGKPVTAQDFVDGWLLGMNAETSGSYRFILTDYIVNGEKYTNGKVKKDKVGVEAPDDKTFVVHIKQPTPYVLGLTTFVKYFPVNKDFFDKNKDKFGLAPDKLLYNGPYVIKSFNPASGVKLKKNDQYWDKDNVDIPKINIKVIKEASTALNLYNGGDLDYATLSSEDVNDYKDKPEFATHTHFRSYYVQFNLGDDIMGNKKLRQALQLSYDPNTLQDTILNNGSKAAYGLIPPEMQGVNDKTFREMQGKLIETDVDEAKKLWKEGVQELGKTPKLTLLVSDDSVEKDTATFLQSQWKKNLGVDVDLVTKPYSSRLQAMRDDKFQMAISAWGADYDDPMSYMDLWAAPKTPFRGSFSNKEYDKLITSAKKEEDEEKRMDELLKTEKILLKEDAVLAPLYYEGEAYLINSNLEGLAYHPWGNPWDYKYATLK